MIAYIRVSLIIACALLVCIGAYAQKKGSAKQPKYTDVADDYFKNGDYFDALKFYKKAAEKNPDHPYVNHRIAECHYNMFNYHEAEVYYGKVAATGSSEFPYAKFWYGLTQKNNGKYEEAKETLEGFITAFEPKNAADSNIYNQAKLDKEGCEVALFEMKRPQKNHHFEVLPGPVNTGESEYAPVIYKHDSMIVITSARQGSKGSGQYSMTGGAFSDNYRFEKKKSSWTMLPDKDEFSVVNSDKNDGAGCFTADHHKFYYTDCDDAGGGCHIMVSELVKSKWQKPAKLNKNINKPGTWNAHPSLTPSGDTMFFASKRDGGLGMHDIWYSIKKPGKGEDWGEAINLGPGVNTPFIDMSPFYYAKENVLFFASSGRAGFGGLDLFMASGAGFSKVSNLGLPFNSNRDDFYLVLGTKDGYLSSNREGGPGNDDIYQFAIESTEELLAEIAADTTGLVSSIDVSGRILHADTEDPAEDVNTRLTLKDEDDEVVRTGTTNKEGRFAYKNLDAKKNYKVVLDNDDPSLTGKKRYLLDDLKISGSAAAVSRVLFENIYFDFDKYDLRPESRKVLEELIAFAKKNPNIQVEMNANTDAIGSDEYNIVLSQNRGKTAKSFLVSNGLDKATLVVKPQGKSNPIATNDNLTGRQLNRRVEFHILGATGYEPQAMVYVLQPKNTLYSIAKQFGMTVEELKALNGLQDNEIKAYTPLRVRRIGDNDIIAPITINGLGAKPAPTANINDKRKAEPRQTKINDAPEADGTYDIYVVEPLNTLFSISKQFGMTVDELKSINGLTGNSLQIGQRLKVKKQ